MTDSARGHAYRPDIDGLRAVAVLPVMAFHFGLPGFRGGFAGVSVFFVISGYLMTKMIGGDLSDRRFSFRAYYERRARRILPALFVMLGCAALVATFVMPPKHFTDFGDALVGSAGFASNLVFWRATLGYFRPPSEWNPLLHTWSLGVEEQFYILYPLFLFALFRWLPKHRRTLLLAVAGISFGLSIWGTSHAPTATFYWLPTRAWELLLGALVAWVEPCVIGSRLRGAASLAGLALVVLGLAVVDPERPFPGLYASPVCAGTALLLGSGIDGGNAFSRALGSRLLVWIGKRSYSLYLWHYPLYVFAERYIAARPLGIAPKLALVASSFVLAHASYSWVEQPTRTRRVFRTRARFGAVFVSTGIALAAVGVIATRHGGWPSRFPGFEAVAIDAQADAEANDDAWTAWQTSKACAGDDGNRCFLSESSDHRAMLWGDSFAASYAYGFYRNPRLFDVFENTSPGCAPVFGYESPVRPQCGAWNRAVPDVIRDKRIGTVILVANWSTYLRSRRVRYEDIGTTVGRLEAMGLRVILVGQSPLFEFAYPDEYFYRRFGAARSSESFFAPAEPVSEINARLSEIAPRDGFFDPTTALCRGESGAPECRFKDDNSYIFRDYGHFTDYGSTVIVDAFVDAFTSSTRR